LLKSFLDKNREKYDRNNVAEIINAVSSRLGLRIIDKKNNDYSLHLILLHLSKAIKNPSLKVKHSHRRSFEIERGVFLKKDNDINFVKQQKTNAEKNVSIESKQKPIKRSKNNIPLVATDDFLKTYAWRKLRMEALKLYGRKCLCCGRTPESGGILHVDHIKPRRFFPELALDIKNLQILCEECNHGKGNWDQTDWRPVDALSAYQAAPDKTEPKWYEHWGDSWGDEVYAPFKCRMTRNH